MDELLDEEIITTIDELSDEDDLELNIELLTDKADELLITNIADELREDIDDVTEDIELLA